MINKFLTRRKYLTIATAATTVTLSGCSGGNGNGDSDGGEDLDQSDPVAVLEAYYTRIANGETEAARDLHDPDCYFAEYDNDPDEKNDVDWFGNVIQLENIERAFPNDPADDDIIYDVELRVVGDTAYNADEGETIVRAAQVNKKGDEWLICDAESS